MLLWIWLRAAPYWLQVKKAVFEGSPDGGRAERLSERDRAGHTHPGAWLDAQQGTLLYSTATLCL